MIHCGQRRCVGWIRGARLCRLAATVVFVVAGLMVFGSAGSGAVAGATTTAAGAVVETARTDAVAAEPLRQDAVPGHRFLSAVRVPACNGDEPGFCPCGWNVC